MCLTLPPIRRYGRYFKLFSGVDVYFIWPPSLLHEWSEISDRQSDLGRHFKWLWNFIESSMDSGKSKWPTANWSEHVMPCKMLRSTTDIIIQPPFHWKLPFKRMPGNSILSHYLTKYQGYIHSNLHSNFNENIQERKKTFKRLSRGTLNFSWFLHYTCWTWPVLRDVFSTLVKLWREKIFRL